MDKQQIKARFFGAHIGCRMQVALNGNLRGYVVTGVYSNIWGWHVVTTDGPVAMDNCQLVLRPSSGITKLESKEMADVIFSGPDWDANKRKSAAGRIYQNLRQGKLYPLTSKEGAIDYLRSINICVPFMGLDPIAEGWAILEKIPANAPQTTQEEEI